MNHIYWLGIRESDLLSVDFLYHGSITFFGNGKNGNICLFNEEIARKNHNIELEIFKKFNKTAILQILHEDPDAKFMFYNPILAYSLENNLKDKVICLNEIGILKVINDKMLCKLWLRDTVKMIETIQMFGNELNLTTLNSLLGNKNEYVIQLPISSGGTGTYIFNSYNQNEIISKISPSQLYIVSPYYRDAISLNIHCVIFENTFQLYPISVQIIKEEGYNLIYKGCDFISAKSLEEKIKIQLIAQAENVCRKLCLCNYRGVCGIDFMLIDEKIFLCEINPRFQASTMPLNLALKENQMLSINEATIQAFYTSHSQIECPQEINVPYSSLAYEKQIENMDFYNNIFQTYFSMYPQYALLKDGYSFNDDAEVGSYMFRTIFPHPLTSIINNELRINELFGGYSSESSMSFIRLKIMLLSFGIKFTPEAFSYIKENGDMRKGNFSAIDLVLKDDFIVNCPYSITHSEYSPFIIRLVDQKLFLFYYNIKITDVMIYYESNLNYKKTHNGIPYSSVAFLATDRLRINYNPVCYYKLSKNACQFCNLPEHNIHYSFDDITTIIEDYIDNESFRHILLGGGSSNPESDFQEIITLTRFLKNKTKKPLYLMSLPPNDLEIISKLYKEGIDEIAFNIEIFQEELARKYMPGKGYIPRQYYFEALEKAVSLWGKTGNVRSMIILGLEPESSLLLGVEKLCKIGVQPMISLFRPMENTPLSFKLPLSIQKTVELYEKIEDICAKYGQSLGPSCEHCQNNTLSIPTKYINSEFWI